MKKSSILDVLKYRETKDRTWEIQESERMYKLRYTDGHGLKHGDFIRCSDGVSYMIDTIKFNGKGYCRYVPNISKYRIDRCTSEWTTGAPQQRSVQWITEKDYEKILSSNECGMSWGYRWRIFDENNNEVPYNKESYELMILDEKRKRGEVPYPDINPRITDEMYARWSDFEQKIHIYVLLLFCIFTTIFFNQGWFSFVPYVPYVIYGFIMTKKVHYWKSQVYLRNSENAIRNRK